MPVRSWNGLRTAWSGTSSSPPHGPSIDTSPPICADEGDGADALASAEAAGLAAFETLGLELLGAFEAAGLDVVADPEHAATTSSSTDAIAPGRRRIKGLVTSCLPFGRCDRSDRGPRSSAALASCHWRSRGGPNHQLHG